MTRLMTLIGTVLALVFVCSCAHTIHRELCISTVDVSSASSSAQDGVRFVLPKDYYPCFILTSPSSNAMVLASFEKLCSSPLQLEVGLYDSVGNKLFQTVVMGRELEATNWIRDRPCLVMRIGDKLNDADLQPGKTYRVVIRVLVPVPDVGRVEINVYSV